MNALDLWNKIELYLIGLLGAVALLLSLYVMVTRYLVPHIAIGWGEEAVVYLLVWSLWLSGSQLVYNNNHIRTDLIPHLLSDIGKRWLERFHYLVGALFCVGLFTASLEVVQFALEVNETSESSLQFPLWVYYLSIPTGLALMGIRYLQQLINPRSKQVD